ncbi:AraC-like ligand-binding domain-containing protein [Fodinicurvata halophila]|uniref:AraC-like ligand-binding domain-containing protein n=1 Tax=Fodinicurvata halophila TaxID=1419723 RepID=UPI0036375BB8
MSTKTEFIDYFDRPYDWSPDPGLSGEARLAAWSDILSRQSIPCRVEAGRARNFEALIRMCSFGPLTFAEVRSKRQVIHRGPEEIARGPAARYFVSVMSRGTGWLHSEAGAVEVPRGSVSFVDGDQPYALEFRRPFRFVTAFLPRAAVDRLLPAAESAHGKVIPEPAGPALAGFLMALAEIAGTGDGQDEADSPGADPKVSTAFPESPGATRPSGGAAIVSSSITISWGWL